MTKSKEALISENSSANSGEFFNLNLKAWKILGLIIPEGNLKCRFFYRIWTYFLNITVSFIFPLHLILGLFLTNATKSELFENVAINSTVICCLLKLLMFVKNMPRIRRMEEILKKLDELIVLPEDLEYFNRYIKSYVNYIERMYMILYAGIGFSLNLAFMLSKEQKLFYPGWFPFNWHDEPKWHYTAALGYQFYAISFLIFQNLANDTFSPKALCCLSGHIMLLYKRVSRIGYDDSRNLMEHEQELNSCVKHHQDLYELFNNVHKIISWPMLFQFFTSLVNLCVAMVALLFFTNDFFYRMYYIMYLTAMIMQLFPVCYYGSDVVLLFEQLHYAVFSCNWTGQTPRFKRHMMLFTVRSLKKTMALAGGMFPIHLTTFFATCKGAYSMFAVVMTMK